MGCEVGEARTLDVIGTDTFPLRSLVGVQGNMRQPRASQIVEGLAKAVWGRGGGGRVRVKDEGEG
jgi:hypothetical protein